MENHYRKYLVYIPLSVVFLLLPAYYFSITSGDRVVGFLTDDAIYLLMAEIYSPWHMASDNLLEFIRSINHFPPLYPVLMGIAGVDSGNPELASRISISMLLIGFAAIGCWIFSETRNLFVSVCIPVITALLPGTLIFSQGLWSEFLFILLLYASLSILAANRLTGQHLLAATLLIALLSLTRTTGISLVLAYCLVLIIQRPKYYISNSLICISPFLYWFFLANWSNTGSVYLSPIGRLLNNSSLQSISTVISDKISSFFYSFYWLITGADNPDRPPFLAVVIILLIILLIIPVIFSRLKNLKIDAFFIIIYLIIIFIWPASDIYYVTRFLFPVIPLFLFYLLKAAELVFRRGRAANYAFGSLLACIIILALPNSLSYSMMAFTSIDEGLSPYRRHRTWLTSESYEAAVRNARFTRDLLMSLQQLRNMVPETECIYSMHTALVMLHSHRISGALPVPGVSDDDFRKGLYGCNYIVAMQLTDQNNTYPEYYPMMRLSGDYSYEVTPIYPGNEKNINPRAYLLTRRP